MAPVLPVLAVVSPVGLVYVIMRSFKQLADALLLLLTGVFAIFTRDDKRRQSCHNVLRIVRRGEDPPNPG